MKTKNNSIIFSIIFLALIALLGCGSAYEGEISDHYDGSEFFNQEESGHSFWDVVKWFWEMDSYDWPDWIENNHYPPPPAVAGSGKLMVTFINHATILIQLDSLNILTDPIWAETPGPISWFGPRRVRAPGFPFEELPKIDLVLISHDHYDHLDLETLEMLRDKFNPIIIAGLGVKSILYDNDLFNSAELDWWQKYSYKNLTITLVPTRHNSGRGMFGGNSTLWGGFVLENDSSRIYFAGDTAFGKFVQEIVARFSHFDLSILPLGNYEKRWIMKNQHMNPDESVETHILLKSKQSIGMHYGTFEEHAEQAYDAHEKDLDTALVRYRLDPGSFKILDFGERLIIR